MQPTSNSCGQTCVAMICGVSWFESCHVFGHMRKTRTRDLVRALRHFKKDVDDHLTVVGRKQSLPKTGTYLVTLKHPRGRHWVVLHDGQIYDPVCGVNPTLEAGCRYTSFLQIRGQ